MERRVMQMDSISLLGPPQPKQPLNQEDFDARFGHVRNRKAQGSILSRSIPGAIRPPKRIPMPFFRWLHRYEIRTEGPRDAFGALLLSALLLPQGLGIGLLIDDYGAGLLSLLWPQLLYCTLGSGRHSSLGSLSHATFLIHSSLRHTQNHIGTLTFYTGLVQLLLFFIPTQRVYGMVSSQLLTGFGLGIFFRMAFLFLPRFIPLSGCNHVNLCLDEFLACFFSAHWPSALLAFSAAVLSLLFHLKLNSVVTLKIGFSIPHEFFIMVLLSIIASQFGFADSSQLFANSTIFDKRRFSLPGSPSLLLLADAVAIALFGTALHATVIAEKSTIHRIRRKQELFVFSLISLISTPFTLPPSFSSPKNSQTNKEAARFSLLANAISVPIIIIFCLALTKLLQYIPTPVIAALALTSFPNVLNEIRQLQQLWKKHNSELMIAIVSFICAVGTPNTCHGFLGAVLFSLLFVAFQVQSPTSDVLIKASDQFYVEENRYRECECPDTPLRILRFSGPLLFINCQQLRKAIYDQVVVVKGLIGVGLGSRTVSLRSCGGPSVIGPKESVAHRSSTNIVITHDGERQASLNFGDSIIRFIVLEMHGVTTVDADALSTLAQIFADLNSDHIRVLFVGLSARVRDQLDISGFHTKVPVSSLYPTLSEALTAARNISMPFHMSVSMNGYRDVIALSTAASHQDISISRHSPEAV